MTLKKREFTPESGSVETYAEELICLCRRVHMGRQSKRLDWLETIRSDKESS